MVWGDSASDGDLLSVVFIFQRLEVTPKLGVRAVGRREIEESRRTGQPQLQEYIVQWIIQYRCKWMECEGTGIKNANVGKSILWPK